MDRVVVIANADNGAVNIKVDSWQLTVGKTYLFSFRCSAPQWQGSLLSLVADAIKSVAAIKKKP